MAKDSDKSSDGPAEHPLVARLTAQAGPEGPGPVTVLHGYLGRGAAADQWRLYASPALDDYLEIPASALIASEELPDGRGNRVWVRHGVSLVRRRMTTDVVRSEFLGGPIAARAAAANRAVPGWPGPRRPTVSTMDLCQTYAQTHCPSCWGPPNCHGGGTYSDGPDCSDYFGCVPDPSQVNCPPTGTPFDPNCA